LAVNATIRPDITILIAYKRNKRQLLVWKAMGFVQRTGVADTDKQALWDSETGMHDLKSNEGRDAV
jgi:hypothetical protein